MAENKAEFSVGQIVRAVAGREAGRLFIVAGLGAGRLHLVDGNQRPLQRPKCKNPRHVEAVSAAIETGRGPGRRPLTDEEIRRLLREITGAGEG